MHDKPKQPTQFDTLDGQRWTFKVTYGVRNRLRDAITLNVRGEDGTPRAEAFDILTVFDEQVAEALGSDHDAMLDLIWHSLEDQAKENNVTRLHFESHLDDESIFNAWDALLTATIDFFREAKREPLRQIHNAMKKLDKRTLETLGEKMKAANLNRLVETSVSQLSTELDKTLNSPTNSAGTTPATSEPTATATP